MYSECKVALRIALEVGWEVTKKETFAVNCCYQPQGQRGSQAGRGMEGQGDLVLALAMDRARVKGSVKCQLGHLLSLGVVVAGPRPWAQCQYHNVYTTCDCR